MPYCVNCRNDYAEEAEQLHHAPCHACGSDGHSPCQHAYPEAEEPDLCNWEVFAGTMETPPENCELEVVPGHEYCAKHQEQADRMAAWEQQEGNE